MNTGLEIAVIGMACRFPGANDLHEFWHNLKTGMESIAFFSDEELQASGIDARLLNDPNYIKAGGKLEEIEYFDASFFSYTPREAEIMNPQIRVFHETVWTALEDAGYNSETYQGLIGLYAGATPSLDWEARALLSGKANEMGQFAAYLLMKKDYLCQRIAYKLNLMGPTFVVQTACSTSLVSIHIAYSAILNGECDLALAGGVTISSHGKQGYMYQEGMISSADGHCRAFDNQSQGTIGGEGSGVVVLKRLENALADRNHIYAVIKGSAINNDGIRKAGFSAASVEGQAEVVKMALQMSEVDPESIGYIETHGTGTILGDSVEIESLRLAFDTPKRSFCGIGAVKSNIGHLDSAAGVAGFIKAVLTLKNRFLPPSLHFQVPNPGLNLIDSQFYIITEPVPWINENGSPLRVGVSSFGIGGTNAHIVLEEAPQQPVRKPAPNKNALPQLLILSARSRSALEEMKGNLARHFTANPSIDLADAVYTLQTGRKIFKYRWIAVCATLDEAIHALTSPDGGKMAALSGEEELSDNGKIKVAAGTDRDSLSRTGRLWLNGQDIDWGGFYIRQQSGQPYRVPLPSYPFERQRYWIDYEPFKSPPPAARDENLPEPDISEWFYMPTWKRSTPVYQAVQSVENDTKADRRSWLVLGNETGLVKQLVKQLVENGQDIVVVEMGDDFSTVDPKRYIIDPKNSSHYDVLFEKLPAVGAFPDTILHAWNITGETDSPPDDSPLDADGFDQAQYYGFYSLLNLVKAIEKQDTVNDIDITLLSNHTQDVIGEEYLRPEKSTILGLSRSISQEYPGLQCRSIDISLPLSGSTQENGLCGLLVDELLSRSNDAEVAYRNNQRWVRFYDPLHIQAPASGSVPFREQGTYLVTGGLGVIGFMFSELFAAHGNVRLILTGRSPFPDRQEWDQWLAENGTSHPVSQKIDRLRRLEANGAEVLVAQANVADFDQMSHVVIRAQDTFGPIHGVIHAAGVIEGGSMRSIRDLTHSDCQLQFEAKVYGLLVLDQLFKEKELDFCWMLSSISCVLGGLGFGAYASSNLFMDAFIMNRNRFKPPRSHWFSLDWDGMDIKTSIDVFERMFSFPKVHQLVVARGGNLEDRINKWVKLETLKEEASVLPDSQTGSEFQPRPELSTPFVAPKTAQQEAIARIIQNLLGYDRIGLRDDFLELGGDSLKAITLLTRVHQQLSVNMPVAEFFNQPTIEGIDRCLSSEIQLDIYESIPAAEEKEFYPVSSAQKRLFIIYQMKMDSTTYNFPVVLSLKGKLDYHRLTNTFNGLISRHESLRTAFFMMDEGPVQKVYKEVEFEIVNYQARADEVAGMVKKFIRPFDLALAPLFRTGLIKLGEEEHILMVDMYHIIADGISYAILVNNFLALYDERELPPLRIQYKDFSQWQNRLIRAGKLEPQRRYWLDRFKKDDIPILSMPLDFTRPAIRDISEGDLISFRVEKPLWEKLNRVMMETSSTLFIILFAAYYMLLSKYSKQEDIVTGTLITGRSHADLDHILGFFVNTLPIRNYPNREKRFSEFLKEVRENTFNAYENKDYFFDELVAELGLQGESSRNPLFDTVFTWNPFHEMLRDAPPSTGLQITHYGESVKFAKFDLNFEASEDFESIGIVLRYSTELFKPETIREMSGYYLEMLENITNNINAKIGNINASHDFLTVGSNLYADADGDFNF
ncbi:MAG: KR domain-containing protein [bacterium]|nr:KR domain-containing protein [bacterium]